LEANLDVLYATWAASKTDASLNALMGAVRRQCGRLTQDDDAAQLASIAVFKGLMGFKPEDSQSFGKWVRVVASHRRLQLIPTDRQKRMTELDENTINLDDPYEFKDLNALTPFQREVASRLMHGDSIAEISESMNLKPNSLRRKLARSVPKVTPHQLYV
jgi:DNA-directed RNA polymerase specialized sigma24 family protein